MSRWQQRVRELYARLDAEIAPYQQLCELRGVCCDFRRSTHRLFATEIEARYLLSLRSVPEPEAAGLCPFWMGGLCTARAERPLGCRVYFCDPSWRDRGEAMYAKYHAELGRIAHEEGVPYLYESWVERLNPDYS